MDSAVEALERLREKCQEQESRLRALTAQKESAEKRIEEIQENVNVLTEASELLIGAAKISREKTIGFVEKVVSLALQSVFQDKTLRFVIETKKRRGVLEADYMVEWTRDGVTVRRPPMRAKGGSLWSVISTALRFLFLLRVKPARRRVLILDEPTTGISSENTIRYARWLRKMAKEFKVQVLVISHKDEMVEAADKVYNVKQRADGVSIAKAIEASRSRPGYGFEQE